MELLETFSATRVSWEQLAEEKPRVSLPPIDMKASDNHPSRRRDGSHAEVLTPCIQSAKIYPEPDFIHGVDNKLVGYISRTEIPQSITRRGTKGTNKVEANRALNQRLRAAREGWWRQKRLKKAEARGLPWGTELVLYQVHVSGAGRATSAETEASSANTASQDLDSHNPLGVNRQPNKHSEAEAFQSFLRQERIRKRTQFKAFSPAAHESRDPDPVPHLAVPSPDQALPAPANMISRDVQIRTPAITSTSTSTPAPFPFQPTSHAPRLPLLHLSAVNRSSSPQIHLSESIHSPLQPGSTPHPTPPTNPQLTTPSKPRVEETDVPYSDKMALRANGTHSPRTSQPLFTEPWRSWDTLEVFLSSLPTYIETLDIWNALRYKGKIVSVEIFADRTKALVRFRPPPKEDFFSQEGSRIEIFPSSGQRIYRAVAVKLSRDNYPRVQERSPLKGKSRPFYPDLLELEATGIGFGVRLKEDTMAILRSFKSTYNMKIQLILNVVRKQIVVKFAAPVDGAKWQFKFMIALSDMGKIFRADHKDGSVSMILDLLSPPLYYREFDEGAIHLTHTPGSLVWREEDSWYRQTSIEATQADMETLKSVPTSLKKNGGLVDIGRWTTFELTFDSNSIKSERFQTMSNALNDFNVQIQMREDFGFISRQDNVFSLIDPSSLPGSLTNAQSSLGDDIIYLPFPVRYQLEVCISNGVLNEFGMDALFVSRLTELANTKVEKAVSLLEHVAESRKRLYDPMEIFDLPEVRFHRLNTKIPGHCNLIRTAVVTATTIRYNSPTVEMTNRIIRNFSHASDRFLRVRFEDDVFRGSSRIHATQANTLNEIFTRIKRTLNNGITIGDRHYEFLAFGNSQLREHGAYFFASAQDLTAANIRAWMGEFSQERNVAKHAARIGQCFSTTRAIPQVLLPKPKRESLLPDIKRNGYTFSDGVGKISSILATFIADDLGLNKTLPPSCYQFRQAGCKGVLAVNPKLKNLEPQLRESQFKFEAQHHGLEIIRCSEFWSASLNRQIIPILSFLGVADEVFLSKQKELIDSLARAMEDDAAAIDALSATVDPNRMTMTLSHMVSEGFRRINEPFVTSLLRLWRAWSMKYLKDKAKITVRKGACVLGVLDETATLQGHYEQRQPKTETASIQEKLNALPEIFIQVEKPEKEGNYEIVEGICFLARNPSLHPGDIRVVRAVNCPQLHHLRDVVVLPQTGDRDLSSMCSGGDLDGDDYIVVWDPELIPRNWFYKPMDFSTAGKEKMAERDVTLNDITTFFVNYIKNDFLGVIAHAHVAWADDPLAGLDHPKCLELARLHSDAVDFNKSGVPARWNRADNPKSWPHFMEKKGKRSRRSQMVLGQLYDAVEKVAFVPNCDSPFDERILSAYEVNDVMLRQAKDLKDQYDEAMQRIMSQHEIKTEFEVWSTFVLDHSKASKDFKFHEEIGRLAVALKDRFRTACADVVGGDDFSALAPFVTAMYKATSIEVQEALHEKSTGQRDTMPFMSFPWLFPGVLADIANGRRRAGQAFMRNSKISKANEGFKITTGLGISSEEYKSFAGSMDLKTISFDPYEDIEAISKPKSTMPTHKGTDSKDPAAADESLIQVTPPKALNTLHATDQHCQESIANQSIYEHPPSSSLLDDLDDLPDPTPRRQSVNVTPEINSRPCQFDGNGSVSVTSLQANLDMLTSQSISSLQSSTNGPTPACPRTLIASNALIDVASDAKPDKTKTTSSQASDTNGSVSRSADTEPTGPYVSRFRRRNRAVPSTMKSNVIDTKRIADFEAWEKANQAALELRKLSTKTETDFEREKKPETSVPSANRSARNSAEDLEHRLPSPDCEQDTARSISELDNKDELPAMRPSTHGSDLENTSDTSIVNGAYFGLYEGISTASIKNTVENKDRRPSQTSQLLSSLMASKVAPTKAENERSVKTGNGSASRLTPEAPPFVPSWLKEAGYEEDEDEDEYKYETIPDPAVGKVDQLEILRAMNRRGVEGA